VSLICNGSVTDFTRNLKVSLNDEAYLKARKEIVDLRIQQEMSWCSLYECIYPTDDAARAEIFKRCIEKAEQAYKNSFYGGSGESAVLKAQKLEAEEAAKKAEQDKLLKAKREKAALLAKAGPARPVAGLREGTVVGAGGGVREAGGAGAGAVVEDGGEEGRERLGVGVEQALSADGAPGQRSAGVVATAAAAGSVAAMAGVGRSASTMSDGGRRRRAEGGGKAEGRLEPGLKKDVLRAGQGGLLAAVVSALRRRQQQQAKRGPVSACGRCGRVCFICGAPL